MDREKGREKQRRKRLTLGRLPPPMTKRKLGITITPVTPKRISILALAKELGKRPSAIVSYCRNEIGMALPDVTDGKRGPRGYVSAGAAASIRELSLNGSIVDQPVSSAQEVEGKLVEELGENANQRSFSFVDDMLWSMVRSLENQKVDPLSQRGKRIIRRALIQYDRFYGLPTFWDCPRCGRSCRPALTAKFVTAFINREIERKRRQAKLYLCPDCGGFPAKIES